jgi:26S proteasome regulatory subunit N8
MWAMFKKVNARERVVGWYSTGPKIKQNDLEINEVFRRYCPEPVLVVVDVQLQEAGIPTKAYVSVQEVQDDISARRFQHLPSAIEALEAEEVGVEHLLRDVKDTNISTLTTQIEDKSTSLKSLITRLKEMHTYLSNVAEGKLPLNHNILALVQQMFNLMPNLNQEHIIKSFNIQTNDNMLAVYVSSLIRSVIALHNLINNKLEYRRLEDMEADEDKAKAAASTAAGAADDKKDKDAKEKKDAPAKHA